jgi:hypothetical protein
MWYPLFQAQWDRFDQHNHQISIYFVKGHHLYWGKGSGVLLFVFLDKRL